MVVPIVPQLPATFYGGSTGGSVTDANNDGVGGVSTVAGLPFYAGQIDGATVLPIYADPTNFPILFAGQTLNIPAQNPGLPGPTLPGPPAFATIGIVHNFSLSAGDSTATTSFFVVEPVPEPTTLALGLAGLLGVVTRRSRG